MHVYVVTGVVLIIALGILVSLVTGIALDTIATTLKWVCGTLLIVGVVCLHRRAKRNEAKQAQVAERLERYSNRR